MVKTPEEIALIQRSMNYWSRAHAFARDYILEHGTDATDFQVKMATTEWGTDLVMKDIKRDGRPHTAVGFTFGMIVRTGVGTSYPHPNQFHHNQDQEGRRASRDHVGRNRRLWWGALPRVSDRTLDSRA